MELRRHVGVEATGDHGSERHLGLEAIGDHGTEKTPRFRGNRRPWN